MNQYTKYIASLLKQEKMLFTVTINHCLLLLQIANSPAAPSLSPRFLGKSRGLLGSSRHPQVSLHGNINTTEQ